MANKKTEFETYRKIDSYTLHGLKFENPSAENFLSYKKIKVTIEEIEESNEVYIERLQGLLDGTRGYNARARIQDEISHLRKQIPNVSSFEAFTEFVNNMETDKSYKITTPFYYEMIRIDKNNDDKFSWALGCNYKVSGRTGYTHPMASGNMVKQFKTEAGAKRSLIKYCDFLFKK